MLSFRYPPHISDKASSETLYSCKVSIKLVFDSSCFPPLPQFISSSLLLRPLSSLSLFFSSKWTAWEIKQRNFTLCRRGGENYGQCQIIELVLRDGLITDTDAEAVSVWERADRLSLSLMSCVGEIAPCKQLRYYDLASAAHVCTQFSLNWQNPIDRDTFMPFILFMLANNEDNYCGKKNWK